MTNKKEKFVLMIALQLIILKLKTQIFVYHAPKKDIIQKMVVAINVQALVKLVRKTIILVIHVTQNIGYLMIIHQINVF